MSCELLNSHIDLSLKKKKKISHRERTNSQDEV